MRTGFAARIAALYAAIFLMMGVQLPFFPLWLQAKGLRADEIGLVLAVPILARVLAVPIATRTADRREAFREVIIAASCFAAFGYLLLGFAKGLIAILLAYAVASLAFTPVMPLAETYALRGLTARGRAYGPVRLWGSAAFIAGTFVAGFVADALSPGILIWFILAAMTGVVASGFALEPLFFHSASTEKQTAAATPLLSDFSFMAVLAAASLIQASHAVYYGFSALAWRAAGFNGTEIALLWGIGVAAEIILFAISARLPAVFDPVALLVAGAIGATVRWSAMAFNVPTAILPLLQMLHAFSFGATHLGALAYVMRRAPVGQGATAQGYLAVALGTVMAAATAISGLLFDAFGEFSYLAMALVAITGGICALKAGRASNAPVP